MKFCYLDESGTGSEQVAVMVGIIADHHRMRPTKTDWKILLEDLSATTGRTVHEIHTTDLYKGNSPFRRLTYEQRAEIIEKIFKWLSDRKHSVLFTAVDKVNFNANIANEPFYNDLGSLWKHMAFHLTLSLQKNFQSFDGTKGNCVLIFDNKVTDQPTFTRLILNPPTWSETYYAKEKKQEPLSEIIDVPHFVDSKQVALIQLADFLCYFLRRHFEFELGFAQPRRQEELTVFRNYADHVFKMALPKHYTFLKKKRCSAAEYFCKFAPACLIE